MQNKKKNAKSASLIKKIAGKMAEYFLGGSFMLGRLSAKRI